MEYYGCNVANKIKALWDQECSSSWVETGKQGFRAGVES